MIKNYLLLFTLITSFQLFSQEVYFLAGSNITKYSFKSSQGDITTPLQSGKGASFEAGYAIPLKYKDIFYDVSITLNDYNTIAGSFANSYKWETKYIGVQNAMRINFPISSNFQLGLNGGLNISKIIYGKQTSNGVVNDLMGQDEFSGVFFSTFFGAYTKYSVNDFGYISLGYSFSKSLNPFNVSPDKLSFNTNQIMFGIHFINKNKK